MAKKLSAKAQEAVYEAVVQFFVRLGNEEAYVRENCFLHPNFEWGYSPYDAINSKGLMYEWSHWACADEQVRAVAAKHKVFLEPYTSWSLGMYPEWS